MSCAPTTTVFYAGLPERSAAVVRRGATAVRLAPALLRHHDRPPAGALAVVLPAVLVPGIALAWGGAGDPSIVAVAEDAAGQEAARRAGAAAVLRLPLTDAAVTGCLRELAAARMGVGLGMVLESMADGFVAADRDHRITAVNEAFCRLTGFARHELLGAVPPYPFVPDEAAHRIEWVMHEAITGRLHEVPMVLRRRGGGSTHVVGVLSRLVDADGTPTGVVGTFRDDTARTAAVAELRESEAQLRRLVDHLPGAAVMRTGDRLWLNPHARMLLGWSEHELSTLDDWFRLLYGARAEEVRDRYERARGEGFPRTVVGRAHTAGGGAVLLESSAYLADNGTEVWLATDITARVEHQRRHQRQAAELHAVLEALPDLVIRVRDDGTVLGAHGSEAVFGTPPPGGVALPGVLPPEASEACLRAMTEALRTGETQQTEYSLEGPAGRRWFSARVARMAADEVVSVIRDITAERQAELDRERMFMRSDEPQAVFQTGLVALEFNPALERLLGWTVADFTGPGAVVSLVHDDDRPVALAAVAELELGHSTPAVRLRLRRRDGGWVTAELTTTPDPERGLLYMTVHDITERVRAEDEQCALARIAEVVAADADPEELFRAVAGEVGELFRVDRVLVARVDADHPTTVAKWVSEAPMVSRTDMDGVVCAVAETGRPVRVDAPAAQPRPRSVAAAPVRVGGRVWGVLAVARGGERALRAGVEERLARFGELVALGISNAQMYARLVAEATTDPLTGLANHRAFKERLETEMERARRHHRPLALALIDLDHFKRVNDRFGHQVGDAVLMEAAHRLQGRARANDLVARVGGEEFAWLMPETEGLEAWQAAEQARAQLAGTPFDVVGHVTASFGVCDLPHAATADDLYRLADGALYWAKHHGRDVAFLYSPDVVEVLSDAEQAERLQRHQALQSIRVLARAVDAKDPSTRQHSERVADLSVAVASALGWPPERVALIREAGLVHDVGKIAVPDSILFKPGKLTDEEFARVSDHAAAGAEIVKDILRPEQVGWVRGHHERWDGRGYPDGLCGEEIPEGARILALADSWDVMTSERPYRQPLPVAEALEECQRCSGGQFWPPAVEAMQRLQSAGVLSALGRIGA